MKIYTGRGDEGETSLFSGERVAKDSLRVMTYGAIDELNSALGMARSFSPNEKVNTILQELQNQLFLVGSDLATKTGTKRQIQRIAESDWRKLEVIIDGLDTELSPLKNFILPSGTSAASTIHYARVLCRRAERLVVKLKNEESDVNRELLVYLNRLSDLLFTLARYENSRQGKEDELWRREP